MWLLDSIYRPQNHLGVVTCRGKRLTIWTKSDAIDRIAMCVKSGLQLSLVIPEFNRVVRTGRGNPLTIGAKNNLIHRLTMFN